MLFYDWPKIKKHSNKKVQIVRAIFFSIMEDPEKCIFRQRYSNIDFLGDSFILRPDLLQQEFHFGNHIEAANYLMLASYRNFAEYLVTGDLTLSTDSIKIPINKLKQNSLLDIQGTDIYFKLEK